MACGGRIHARNLRLHNDVCTMETQNLYQEANRVASRINHGEQLARFRANNAAIEESPGLDGK
jgi:hypothetical protein